MIIRTRKNKNYTTLCNVALNDPELSLKAKGLFAFLMSKPDDWKISYRGLMTQLKEGQRAILGALAELEEVGYLDRELTQNKAGHIFFTSVLKEEPVRAKRTHGATTVATVRTLSTHGKRTRAKRTPIVNTNEANTDKEKLNKSLGSKLKAPNAHTSPTIDPKQQEPNVTGPGYQKATAAAEALRRRRLEAGPTSDLNRLQLVVGEQGGELSTG